MHQRSKKETTTCRGGYQRGSSRRHRRDNLLLLPFDPALATDEEICGVLAGQAVVWYNRLSRGQESAIVGRKGARITQLPDGQRVVHFCCPATGYRSLLATSILKVGRGQRSTTKGQETETVEVA